MDGGNNITIAMTHKALSMVALILTFNGSSKSTVWRIKLTLDKKGISVGSKT